MVRRESGGPFGGSTERTTQTSSAKSRAEELTVRIGPSKAPNARAESGEYQSVAALGPGTRVGHFVLERKLGEGGMGIVFLARDLELNRPVAVKVLRLQRDHADDAHARLRMLREAQAMAMLSHPNLPTLYEVGTIGQNIFLAMEYVTGQPLHEWLAQPRPLESVLGVFDQAGRGLQAMHARGLVHRDFKPANVLVTADGQAKLLDLGIARRVIDGADSPERFTLPDAPEAAAASSHVFDERLTQDGAILGTPAYMPPEQILGEPASPASDQFAFAVALFEALSGSKPFAGTDRLEIMKQVLAEERRRWPDECSVPPKLRAAIERALSLYPEQRFASMAAFLDACWNALGLRGQVQALTQRWQSNEHNDDFLLRDGNQLREGHRLISEHPEWFSSAQTSFLQASWRVARRGRLFTGALLGGLALLLVALVTSVVLLRERDRQLERALQQDLTDSVTAVRGEVKSIVKQAEENMLLLYDQRRAWMPLVDELALPREATSTLSEAELVPELSRLNDFFRPVVEHTRAISSLRVSRDEGLEFLLMEHSPDGSDGGAHRFYSRLRNPRLLGDRALVLFWPEHGDGPPTTRWLDPGTDDPQGRVRRGGIPTLQSGLPADSRMHRQVTWSEPYRDGLTGAPTMTAAIGWQRGGHRYTLAVNFILNDISKVTTKLDYPRFLVLVTTNQHRVVGLPRDQRFETPREIHRFFAQFGAEQGARVGSALPPIETVGIPAVTAAIAAEPAGKTTWPFEIDGITYWASQSEVDGHRYDLRIYALEH